MKAAMKMRDKDLAVAVVLIALGILSLALWIFGYAKSSAGSSRIEWPVSR